MYQISAVSFLFLDQIAQIGYFRSKTEKVNTIIKFCIFQLAWVSNFHIRISQSTKFQLKMRILIVGRNLGKKSISCLKQKK